jgi:hypothetical protein
MPTIGRISKAYSNNALAATVVNIDANNPLDISNFIGFNPGTSPSYIQIFFLAAASVTLGTTVPDMVIPLPTGGGAVVNFTAEGWHTGGPALSVACTITAAGSGAPQTAAVFTVWKKL